MPLNVHVLSCSQIVYIAGLNVHSVNVQTVQCALCTRMQTTVWAHIEIHTQFKDVFTSNISIQISVVFIPFGLTIWKHVCVCVIRCSFDHLVVYPVYFENIDGPCVRLYGHIHSSSQIIRPVNLHEQICTLLTMFAFEMFKIQFYPRRR